MDSAKATVESIAELIHLAVAPIFLLTAVATTLMVFAGRLARIVDRGRILEASTDPHRHDQLLVLETRARLIYRALFLGVSAAIMVCLLMTCAFAASIFEFHAARVVALLFILALFSYTGALVCLLREVFLAIGNFRLGIHPTKK